MIDALMILIRREIGVTCELACDEAGHAFASYIGRDIYPSALRRYTSETAEVHSMSMEFFTWPWMEGFFGSQTTENPPILPGFGVKTKQLRYTNLPLKSGHLCGLFAL